MDVYEQKTMIQLVGKNALWNVIGVCLPILAGLLAVPLLLHGLGQSRVGVFSLVLGLFGFAGIFDLGLGRALTQAVASEQGKGSNLLAIAGLARKALVAVFALGVAWGVGLWFSANVVVQDIFHLEGAIATETTNGIYWLAVTLPVALVSTCMIGALEGLQLFRLVNLLRAPLGAATFLVPALVAQFADHLDSVIASLTIVRMLGLVLWGAALVHHLPLFSRPFGVALSSSAMWRFSGWLSVSNLVGPIMVYADRFYLTGIFSPAMVALYTVPLDTFLRATIIPGAAMNAAFPALAHMDAQGEHASARKIINAAGRWMLGLWFLPLLLAGLFLPYLLDIWLGEDFSRQITPIAQWIMLGVFINGFAHIPFALLQSVGRADLTAKLHVVELPIYAILFVYFVNQFGVFGAAIAWFFRIALDTIGLYLFAASQFPVLRVAIIRLMLWAGGACIFLGLVFIRAS